MGTQARGVSTTDDSHAGTPLTREAMAELLELHRAGQQVDRETESERHDEWLRAFTEHASTAPMQAMMTAVCNRIVEAPTSFGENRRFYKAIEKAVAWGVFKGVLAVLGLPIAIVAVIWILATIPPSGSSRTPNYGQVEKDSAARDRMEEAQRLREEDRVRREQVDKLLRGN